MLDAVLVTPDANGARASLLICHGIGETVEHWLAVQQLLAANGVASLVGGTPTDPAGTITAVVTDPSATPVVTTYTYPASMTKVSVGLYTVLVPCTVAGTWEAVVSASAPSAGYGAAKTEWTVAPV